MLSQRKPGNERAEKLKGEICLGRQNEHLSYRGITIALRLSVVPKDENKQQATSDSKENKQRIITWPQGMPMRNLLSRINPQSLLPPAMCPPISLFWGPVDRDLVHVRLAVGHPHNPVNDISLWGFAKSLEKRL